MTTSYDAYSDCRLGGLFIGSLLYGIVTIPVHRCSALNVNTGISIWTTFLTSHLIKSRKDWNHKLIIIAWAMFIVSSVHMAQNLASTIRIFRGTSPRLPSTFLSGSSWSIIVHTSTSTAQYFLGDSVLIYRCFVIYGRRLWVIILPSFLLLGTLVFGIGAASLEIGLNRRGSTVKMDTPRPTTMDPMTKLFLTGLSIASTSTTVLTTGLIIFRICSRRCQDTLIDSPSGGMDSLIRILLESGALPTIAIVLTRVGALQGMHPAALVFAYTTIPIICISFDLVIIRVAYRGKVLPKSGGSSRGSDEMTLPRFVRQPETGSTSAGVGDFTWGSHTSLTCHSIAAPGANGSSKAKFCETAMESTASFPSVHGGCRVNVETSVIRHGDSLIVSPVPLEGAGKV